MALIFLRNDAMKIAVYTSRRARDPGVSTT